MLDPLTNLIDNTNVRIHECRICGITLPAGSETCHHCGSEEIAHYEW